MSKRPKKMTDEQIAKIKQLSSEGLSSYAIAKKLSIPPGVARYHIQRSKLLTLEGSLTHKVNTYKDSTAIHLLKQQLVKLDQKKNLLQEIIDQEEMGH